MLRPDCNSGTPIQRIIVGMGQHKTYERGPRWYALLLGFSVGILLVAGALYGMAHNSGGLMGARGLGKVLGLAFSSWPLQYGHTFGRENTGLELE